jgi:hypothetical protein
LPSRYFEVTARDFLHKGWRYVKYDEPQDVDGYVTFHFARHEDGREESLDFSPHQLMDRTTFELFVDFGFPTSTTLGKKGPLKRMDLSALAEEAAAKRTKKRGKAG